MFYVDFNYWLKNYGYIIAIVIVVIIALIVAFLLIRNKKKDKSKISDVHNEIILALGGIENIVSASAKMSRLNVVLSDYSLIDEEKLKELGVSRIIKMTNKMTLLLGEDAKAIENLVNEVKK